MLSFLVFFLMGRIIIVAVLATRKGLNVIGFEKAGASAEYFELGHFRTRRQHGHNVAAGLGGRRRSRGRGGVGRWLLWHDLDCITWTCTLVVSFGILVSVCSACPRGGRNRKMRFRFREVPK